MADRILTLDIGSSKALLAEFSVKGGQPVLLRFASGPLPVEGDDVGSPERLADVVRTLIRENGIKPAPMYVALPGQSVFARFFKLPPLGKDQVGETVAAEAEQSVPFPIDEVVWDYQVLGSNDGVELDAVLVAVKQDNVSGMTSAVTAIGIEPAIVDAAPVALYNAARHCLGANVEGCTMVLDIGHRSTGLVFLEGDRVFTRNIAVAGLAITQEIQKTFNCTYREAETLKLQSGFVALGGTYAVTEDQRADRLSKIIRTVVTRLHAEVSRSINFYRSQQGGTAPTRVLLTGTSSLLPYMDQFFADKFQVPVEYFNPFETIQVGPGAGLDLQSANQIVTLANSVGLALRHTGGAALEMNLLPPAIVARKAFRRRVPFFILSAAAILVTAFLWYRYADRRRVAYEEQKELIVERVGKLKQVENRLSALTKKADGIQAQTDVLRAMAENRSIWQVMIEALRASLPDGAWIRTFKPDQVNGDGAVTALAIDGRAFEDSLKARYGDGTSAMETFTKKLVTLNPKFFAGVDDLKHRLGDDGLRAFSFQLRLAAPVGAPTVLRVPVAGDDADETTEEE